MSKEETSPELSSILIFAPKGFNRWNKLLTKGNYIVVESTLSNRRRYHTLSDVIEDQRQSAINLVRFYRALALPNQPR